MRFNPSLQSLLRSSAAVLLAAAVSAHAAAPMAKSSPGYYRMMLGDFEVTALNDGIFMLPVDKLLTGTTPEHVHAQLAKSYLKVPVETSVNAYLVNTGSKLVLIDTGAGGKSAPTVGSLAASLKAAGYAPEQVDEIYITHMHGDHIGGLVADGKAVFPNAVVRAGKNDAEHFLSQAKMDAAPDAAKGGFKNAMATLDPYIKAGKFKPIDGNAELVPGVKAVATNGHTPGHAAYLVESRGQKLMLWGDLMHVAAVQFGEPDVTITFDSDSPAARAQREKAFADAAREGYLVAAAHLSFPGIGRLRAESKGYTFIPVNYVPVK